MNLIEEKNTTKITNENVFNRIKLSKFFDDNFLSFEIDFIASHFYELCEPHEEELLAIHVDTLFNIFNNRKLKITSEDQLLHLINKLYSKNVNCSFLYETVLFENVSTEAMQEFITVFDNDDMTKEIWNRLIERLLKDTKKEDQAVIKNRYMKKAKTTE